jgi:hypothetical protein
MLLNDIGSAPNTKIKKINQYLETNYGFKITENVSGKDLLRIVEQIQDEIIQLKIQGGDAKESPEISKRLMILEGLRSLREFALPGMGGPEMGIGIEPYHQEEFEKVVGNLSRYVIDSIKLGDKMEDALMQAMKEYRSSRYRFPDQAVEGKVRSNCGHVQTSTAPSMVPVAGVMEDDDQDVAREDEEASMEESEKWIQGAHVDRNKGGLHKALHVPQGETIPKSKIASATHSDNPHTRHMAQFAKNVAKENTMNDPYGANVSRGERQRTTTGVAEPNKDALGKHDTSALDRAGIAPAIRGSQSAHDSTDPNNRIGKHAFAPAPFRPGRKPVRELSNDTLSSYIDKSDAQVKGITSKPGYKDNAQDVNTVNKRLSGGMKAAHRIHQSEGTEMRENKGNLVKHLRTLLETEVSQAEVMMAAKGFAQELQEMVEKIGRLQNEDLPPVTDQMRETYGMESASAFQTQIYGALQSVMDSLYTAKQQVDDAVGNMASTGQVDATIDMDKDIDMDMDGEMDGGEGDLDVDADLDLDNIGDELGGDDLGAGAGLDDEFAGAEEEDPLGREMKTESLKRKIAEMRKIVEKAKRLKEAAH